MSKKELLPGVTPSLTSGFMFEIFCSTEETGDMCMWDGFDLSVEGIIENGFLETTGAFCDLLPPCCSIRFVPLTWTN